MINLTQFSSSAGHFIAYNAISSQNDIILIGTWITISHRWFKLQIFSRIIKTLTY